MMYTELEKYLTFLLIEDCYSEDESVNSEKINSLVEKGLPKILLFRMLGVNSHEDFKNMRICEVKRILEIES